MTAAEKLAEAIAKAIHTTVIKTGKGHKLQCPCHEDKKSSLTIYERGLTPSVSRVASNLHSTSGVTSTTSSGRRPAPETGTIGNRRNISRRKFRRCQMR
jgi:hypothetical protein